VHLVGFCHKNISWCTVLWILSSLHLSLQDKYILRCAVVDVYRRFRGYSDVGIQGGSFSKISVRLPDNAAWDLRRICIVAAVKSLEPEVFWLVSNYQLNAQFLYSITIYMLNYNPRHVSSSTMLIFRRTNCIITASGIVTLCKRPYNMPVKIN
jgi:hypothetical protein